MSTLSAHRAALRIVGVVAADIKLAHSVFAMPFALLAAFMAALPARKVSDTFSADWRRFGGQLALIVGAMVTARTVAMLANRLIDRRIDEANPRTAGRALPSGRLSSAAATTAMVASAAAFFLVCAGFGWWFDNWWPVLLGLPVLTWISAYPLLKRFTALCHIYLGSSLAISPLAAAIAIDPAALGAQPALWLLSGMVLCWVAGFDIIYALQDVEIDQRERLHSMPSRLGVAGAMWVSRGLHVIAVACLASAWLVDARLGGIFATGVLIVAALLMYEHLTVARWGTTRLALAFFGLNGLISCLLGALGIIDVLVGGAK